MEDILSCGVLKRYQSFYYRSKLTASGRVLQELGKTLPEAAAIYKKCFEDSPKEREDYAQAPTAAERKVVWIRAALIEGKLQVIVENFMKNPKYVYYSCLSQARQQRETSSKTFRVVCGLGGQGSH